jgi:glycosyltransferase 2 family protein
VRTNGARVFKVTPQSRARYTNATAILHNSRVFQGSRLARAAAAMAVVALGAALSVRAFAGVDWRGTLHALRSVGPAAPLVLVPFLGAMLLDSAGLCLLLRALGRPVPLRDLLPIRIGAEALHVTTPAGFLVADSATATLLQGRCGVPLSEGAVLAIARKWLVMRGHAAYILAGAVLGAGTLLSVSRRCGTGPWLPVGVAALALVPLLLSRCIGAGFRGKPALARLQQIVARAPWGWLRRRTASWREGAAALDERFARVGAATRLTWAATTAFLGCWLLESVESAVVLWLVGAPLDWTFALAAEVGISLVRSVSNVAPAGLGVQDAGYATLLPAMGLSADSAAAFVLIKRGKELAWIAAGYALLAILRRRIAVAERQANSVPVGTSSALQGVGC